MRRPVLLLLALLLAPVSTHAQSHVNAVHERVRQMQDTAELRALEEQHRGRATLDDQLTAGIAALRLWELTEDRAHARRSRRHFDAAAKTDPRSAWAHYGNALTQEAEFGRDGFFVVDNAIARALGEDAASRGRRALERAVRLDPALPGAAALLTRFSVETRDRSALEQARAAFEEQLAKGDDSHAVLLGLARAARELGDYEAAANAARQVAGRGCVAGAEGSLELAISLANVDGGADEGAAAYDVALQDGNTALLERMWDDATIVTRTGEDIEWRRAREDGERRELLKAMWGMRGALSDMSASHRAVEHYRRLNVAWREYRRYGVSGAAPLNALRLEKIDERYEDRGIIYIRHGRPEMMWTGEGLPESVTNSPAGAGQSFQGRDLASYQVWFYRANDGQPLSFHFQRFGGTAGYSVDYTLLRDLPCPLPPDIAAVDQRLYPLTVGNCDRAKVRTISLKIVRDTERALTSDSHRPALDRVVPFAYDWYSFRGENGMTEVVAAIGVPFDRLPPQGMPLRMSLSVVDTLDVRVARATVDAPQITPDAAAGDMLRSFVRVQVQPTIAGAYRVSIRDANDELTGMTYGGSLIVENYAFREFVMISDVVLAEPRVTGTFQRGGHRLALSPTQVFAGGAFRAYYELYNLAPGTRYRTELHVRPADRGVVSSLLGRDNGVKLEFEDVVPDEAGDIVRELRDIEVPFEPGDYLITVTVHVPGTRPISKERRFTVVAQ